MVENGTNMFSRIGLKLNSVALTHGLESVAKITRRSAVLIPQDFIDLYTKPDQLGNKPTDQLKKYSSDSLIKRNDPSKFYYNLTDLKPLLEQIDRDLIRQNFSNR